MVRSKHSHDTLATVYYLYCTVYVCLQTLHHVPFQTITEFYKFVGPKFLIDQKACITSRILVLFFCLALNKDHSLNLSVSYKFMRIVLRFAQSYFSIFDDSKHFLTPRLSQWE